MKKIPATVGILTLNNQTTIERALKSVCMFDDILVSDGGSTDETLAIAARYGARIIRQDSSYKDAKGRLRDYGGARQQMLDAAGLDWFLYIDSDEAISDGLREEIRAVTSKTLSPGSPLVYKVPIGIVLDGRQVRYSSNFPGYQYRFFNRSSGAHFIKPVHERIAFDTKTVSVGTLVHPWNTFTTREESSHYLRDMSTYRAMEVRMSLSRSASDVVRYYVYPSLRASVGAFAKSVRNYLLHGFKETVPVSTEAGRVISPLLLVYGVLRARVGRKVKHISKKTAYEPELRLVPKLLSTAKLGVFVDVGANAGAYVEAATKIYAPERVYAFEPNPRYIESLRAKFRGIHVEQLALSSVKGTARLKIPFINGSQYATRGTLEHFSEAGETSSEYIDVPTYTLDQYCKDNSLAVAFIKIDVEGHERSVLAGARSVLQTQQPMLIIEIEQRHHKEPIREIFDDIIALGYEGWFFDAVLMRYEQISMFSVEKNQSIRNFKTPMYCNNFVFLKSGSPTPLL